MKNFAERLGSRRKELGLTQADLAKRCGIGQSAIAMMESGDRKASKHIGLLSAALACDPVWLETGTGQMAPMSPTAAKIAALISALPTSKQNSIAPILEMAIGSYASDSTVEQKMPITKSLQSTRRKKAQNENL